MLIKCLTWLVLLMLLSGCQYVQIQSSQLYGLVAQFRSVELDLADNSWSVRYADHEAIVYAVTVPEGTLFTNKAGDQVLFDGWSIRQVKGMGRGRLNYQNIDSNNQRTFMRDNRTIAIHSCIAWQKQEQSGILRFSQQCRDREPYVNSILVAKDGSVALIHQVVDDRYTTVTLTKLN